MASIGKLPEFDPEHDTLSAFVERLELFLETNEVAVDKHVAVLLSAVGSKTYALLRNLLSPVPPKTKSFRDIVDILKRHFDRSRWSSRNDSVSIVEDKARANLWPTLLQSYGDSRQIMSLGCTWTRLYEIVSSVG